MPSTFRQPVDRKDPDGMSPFDDQPSTIALVPSKQPHLLPIWLQFPYDQAKMPRNKCSLQWAQDQRTLARRVYSMAFIYLACTYKSPSNPSILLLEHLPLALFSDIKKPLYLEHTPHHTIVFGHHNSPASISQLFTMKITNVFFFAFMAIAIATPITEPDTAAVSESELEKRVGEDCKVVRRFRTDLEGTCVDTRNSNCQGGTLYTGRCPGPNWNRCCIT